MHGFDTANSTVNHAHDLAAKGYGAAGLYLSPTRTTKEQVDGLHSVDIKVFSIWEKGNPTSDGYFSAEKGKQDGEAAAAYAKVLGMPSGKPIFACFDYDTSSSAINGVCRDYQEAFRTAVMAEGYLAACYGSGLLCSTYVSAGISHYGFLAQSRGFAGFNDYKSSAAIVQGPSQTILGLDCDLDFIQDESVLW